MIAAQANLADYLYHFPETLFSQLTYWLFQHPFLVNGGAKLFMLAEGCFLLGFFTRRFDRLLIGLGFVILLQTYLFADVFFAETLVILFAFFPVAWWERMWLRTTPDAIHKMKAGPAN